MFTGLVEAVGILKEASGDSPRRLTIESELPAREIQRGDSVAIDGVCLTVVAHEGHRCLCFEAATETLARTTLGSLAVGRRVNLERALRLGDRLGGHVVSGHVDGIGFLRQREQRGSALYLGFEAPPEVARLTAARGSITIAGVSLTVTDARGDLFFVGIIPHTLDHTTLGSLKLGDSVNLEADLFARYIERYFEYTGAKVSQDPGLTMDLLTDKGFA